MKYQYLGIAVLIAFSLGLSACYSTNVNSNYPGTYGSSGGVNKPITKDAVVTEKWVLTKINNTTYQGGRVTLELSSEKKVFGFSGCNRFFASVVELTSNKLRFGPIGSTKMLCANQDSNALERNYLNALRNVTNYQKDDYRMVLTGSSTNLVFMKEGTR